ncbi:17644_t:CDS:2 [Rhizophagus irregularis]|nr:17644_t:CDS:2 [Rhizophagus irregularis]
MGRCKSSKRITTHRKSKNSIQGIEKSNKTSNTNDKDVKGVSDIIDHNLDVIFVGVVPSCKNAARKEHYYCSSSNQFYKLLHESGFTERKLKPEEDGSLLNYKIGLMNIQEIREEIETFIEKIRKYKPKFICFNGKDGFATFMSIKNDVAINKKYEFGFKNDDKIDWIDENEERICKRIKIID